MVQKRSDHPNVTPQSATLNDMRNPPGDGADQRSARRRDHAPDRNGQRERAPAAGSVFAPGYDPSRPEPADGGPPGSRASSPGASWYGSAAGGAAGRGPVRGYPPVPGQPPPMYPPGQFAAWNRQRPGPGRPGEPSPGPGPSLAGQSARASGPHTGPIAPGGGRPGPDRPENGYPGSPAAGGPGGASKSRYYEQDLSADPSYSVLAVSDPAADVTSTQTWQAVAEGRATGVWTAPARPDRREAAATGWRSADGTDTASIPRRPGVVDALGRTAIAPDIAPGDGAKQAEPGRRVARGHSGAHTSPHQMPRSPRRAAGSAGPNEPQPRRTHAGNVRLAIAAAAVLVLAAAGGLSYVALHHRGGPGPAAAGARKPKSSPSVSASPTPSLGLYGRIATRASDPAPLTMSELYPVTFTAGGTIVARTADSKGTSCAAELVGSRIQSAVGSAACTQVVRATYLASSQGVMGTIGVLNLSTAKAATTLAHAADANDFISQLPGKHGATTKIGQGTGIEEAAAKGHYLILIWAEFTNLRKPRTTAQLKTVEQFMSELLQNTANVSLTHRMLTGIP